MPKQTDPAKLLKEIEAEIALTAEHLATLREKQRKLREVIATIDEVAQGTSEQPNVPLTERPKRLEFAIMSLLGEFPEGLNTDEMLILIRQRGRSGQKRTTLSSTISRLSGEHIYKDKISKKWRKI